MTEFPISPGDTGLIVGGWYTDGKRRMFCMADHRTKGIWLDNEEGIVTTTREEDARLNWYGTRAEFDAAGWRLEESDA